VCFGDIQYELKMTYRMPEETEEEKRAAAIKKMKEEEEKKAAAEGGDKKASKKSKEKKEEEDKGEEKKKEEPKKEPPKPLKVWLYQASIHDLLVALDKMQDYDYVLSEMGIMKADVTDERFRDAHGEYAARNEK
jgi:hypothetical protein